MRLYGYIIFPAYLMDAVCILNIIFNGIIVPKDIKRQMMLQHSFRTLSRKEQEQLVNDTWMQSDSYRVYNLFFLATMLVNLAVCIYVFIF